MHLDDSEFWTRDEGEERVHARVERERVTYCAHPQVERERESLIEPTPR